MTRPPSFVAFEAARTGRSPYFPGESVRIEVRRERAALDAGLTPEESYELLKALNEINSGIYGIQAYYRDGRVIFATDMLADTLQPEELERACALISGCADKYDDELQAKFGGRKTFEGEE